MSGQVSVPEAPPAENAPELPIRPQVEVKESPAGAPPAEVQGEPARVSPAHGVAEDVRDRRKPWECQSVAPQGFSNAWNYVKIIGNFPAHGYYEIIRDFNLLWGGHKEDIAKNEHTIGIFRNV